MENFVIAITRTSGSGATSIGRILAKNLGVELYDRNLLRLASDDSGISQELFARADEDQKQSLLFRVSQKVYKGGVIPPERQTYPPMWSSAALRITCCAISRIWCASLSTRPERSVSRRR